MSQRVERRATVFAVGDLPQIVDLDQRREFLGAEKRRYSGGFQGKGIKRGIPVEKQTKFPQLAAQLGTSFNDPAWANKSNIFWAEYNTSIPFGRINAAGKIEGGIEINASYTIEDNGDITCDELMDYILFEMMQDDKEVSTNPELFDTDQQNYAFFCIDQTVETERAKQLLQYKMDANEALTKLIGEYKEAPEKHQTRIRAIAAAVDTEASSLHFRMQGIEEALASIMAGAEKDPAKFLKVLDDKNLVTKAFITDCVEAGIFQRFGNQYVYEGETYESIGELAKYINNPAKTELKAQLQSQLKEYSAMAIIQG